MEESRNRGTELYKTGEYAAAAEAYSKGLQLVRPSDASTRALLLSNRAACALALGDTVAAAADCYAGLALTPTNPKLHYRLAKALAQQDLPKAAAAIAAAVAFLRPEPPSGEFLELYSKLATATSHAASAPTTEQHKSSISASITLPTDPARIATASSFLEISDALKSSAQLVVIRPGIYIMPASIPACFPHKSSPTCTFLGVGKVELKSANAHAVWVQSGDVTFANMRFAGAGESSAAVCVSPPFNPTPGGKFKPAKLRLIDCRVEDYPGGGLLVATGAHADVIGSSFKRCGRQAVEVREGSSLVMACSTIEDSAQGVSAYGGAERVVLQNCSILRSQREGVLAAGSYENAATAAQDEFGTRRLRPFTSADSRRATEQAEAYGKQLGVELDVVIENCTIAQSGMFGLSLDSGCRAQVIGCRLEANDPYAVFVKGGTDASVTACQFVVPSGKSAKSPWAKKNGAGALQQSGELAYSSSTYHELVLSKTTSYPSKKGCKNPPNSNNALYRLLFVPPSV